MAESTSTQINAESHLLLDHPLLRLPHELLRKNFKSSQRAVERDRDYVVTNLKQTANASITGQAVPETLVALDGMISRMQGLKRKLEGLHENEMVVQQHSKKRIEHLRDLYEIPSLSDVKYDQWSRTRVNRLLVDYLLRSGYVESAKALAKGKDIEELVDTDVFVNCNRIKQSLRQRKTTDCLAWCAENKQALKKLSSNLEFELRLQQYIELVRTCLPQKLLEATHHARKYLLPHRETQTVEIHRASGLLAFGPDTQAEPYRTMYSSSRWDYLSRLFADTHHALYSLPAQPLLYTALSAGLSSLKTPSCHSSVASSSSNRNSTTTMVCPICSTELNVLALNVPYAHHTKSLVETNPIVLPNGRIYGHERLLAMSATFGMPNGKIKDPITGDVFDESVIRKVYIT